MVYSLIIKADLAISGTNVKYSEVSLWRISIMIPIAAFTVEPAISCRLAKQVKNTGCLPFGTRKP